MPLIMVILGPRLQTQLFHEEVNMGHNIEFKLIFDESWQLLHQLYQLPHGTYDRIRLLTCLKLQVNKFNQL